MLLCFCATISFAQQPGFSSSGIKNSQTPNKTLSENSKVQQDELEEEEEEEEEIILYKWEKCLQCHNFSKKELEKQERPARKKHLRVLKSKTPCYECHDYEEVVEEICCHMVSVK